jgi:CRP/FNR family cyclic AMP-dependent transcriptional regulator
VSDVSSSVLQKLQQIHLFEEIRNNPVLLEELQKICRVRSIARGELVFNEGDAGHDMFIVHTGSVEIRKKTRAGDSYTVVVLKAENNVFFGELALIDDERRSATVMAREDSEFLIIAKKDFLDLGDRHPEIGLPVTRAIAKVLAGRLRKTTDDLLTIFDALVNELQP